MPAAKNAIRYQSNAIMLVRNVGVIGFSIPVLSVKLTIVIASLILYTRGEITNPAVITISVPVGSAIGSPE